MPKKKKNRGQYAAFGYSMLTSDAFRSLSGSALKVYFEIRCRYNGKNNGELNGALRPLAKLLGIGKSTVNTAIEELIDKGFLFRTRRGHFHSHHSALYGITDKRYGSEIRERNSWRDWKKKKYKFPKAKESDWPKKKEGPVTGLNSPKSNTENRILNDHCPDQTTVPSPKPVSSVSNSGHYYIPYGGAVKRQPVKTLPVGSEDFKQEPNKIAEKEDQKNRKKEDQKIEKHDGKHK